VCTEHKALLSPLAHWFEQISNTKCFPQSQTYDNTSCNVNLQRLSLQLLKKKAKLSLKQAMEAHRVVGHQGSHIFYTIGSQMATRLSALRACRPLTSWKIPVTHSC
jgi:hypothetical protein